MLKFDWFVSKLRFWTTLTGLAALCLLALSLVAAPSAFAQGTSEFTLQTGPVSPPAVAPGGTSSISITVGSVNGFSGSVALGCQVSSNQTTNKAADPVCTVSPSSVTPPAGSTATATATITTSVDTTTVGYNIVITATGPTTSYSAPGEGLTVLAVSPQFTITIQTSIQPSSVPAGSGAQALLVVNPTNGYSSPQTCNAGTGSACGITLYCSTITPLVTIAPYCSFTYSTGSTLEISGDVAQTATLTINTWGPVQTGAATRHHPYYALWLPIPLLGFVGLGAAFGGKQSRKALGLLALLVLGGSLLLLPACSNTGNTTSTPNGVTPANTYTFTIVGVDGNGVVSSNTGSGSSAPSVSLSVTAPPKT